MPIIIGIIVIISLSMLIMAIFRFMMNSAANVLQYLPQLIASIVVFCLSIGFLGGWILGCIKASKKIRFILKKYNVNIDEIIHQYASNRV